MKSCANDVEEIYVVVEVTGSDVGGWEGRVGDEEDFGVLAEKIASFLVGLNF